MSILYNKANSIKEGVSMKTTNQFWYGLALRPLAIGAQPVNHVGYLSPEEAGIKFPNLYETRAIRHGALAYDIELTADQINQYELVAIPSTVAKIAEKEHRAGVKLFDYSLSKTKPVTGKEYKIALDDVKTITTELVDLGVNDTEKADIDFSIKAANSLIEMRLNNETEGVKGKVKQVLFTLSAIISAWEADQLLKSRNLV